MTQNEQIIKEVNREIDEVKLTELKKEIRAYKLGQLEEQERLKAEKEKIEEKLRIIKLNLENLDKGNFEAIEERMRKSEQARQVDPLKQIEKIVEKWCPLFPTLPVYPPNPWITWWTNDASSGTYTTLGGKTFFF